MRIGPYDIIDKLSAGRAEVWLGRDTRAAAAATPVVLKLALDDDGDLERELALLQRLRHPNVVSFLEHGDEGGRTYLALEHVPGVDLEHLLSSLSAPGLDVEIAAYIGMSVLEGLQAAHHLRDANGDELHVVHRDVTPSNVLLSPQGSVKLADFGIAKFLHAPRRTATGVIKGKFAYLSPEQARGRALDARTDLFSVGLVLFEMLAGRALYRAGDDFELIELAMQGEVSGALDELPATVVALRPILEKALRRSPRDRYASAEAFKSALASFVLRPDLARRALAHLVHQAAPQLMKARAATPVRRDD